MLQLKKVKAYFGMWLLCMGLCACSGNDGEIILIGSEEGQVTWDESLREETSHEASVPDGVVALGKNRREKGEYFDEITGMSNGIGDDANKTIRVYVCGAVAQPGVVEIPAGSRVEEALDAAGGFVENASRVHMNLAAWVEDGQMIYFPTQEEVHTGISPGAWSQIQEPGGMEADTDAVGLVNINTADVEKLCTLPGIGESRARDIIAYRETNGFFDTCEDIMCVPGIKDGLFEKICDKITVK